MLPPPPRLPGILSRDLAQFLPHRRRVDGVHKHLLTLREWEGVGGREGGRERGRERGEGGREGERGGREGLRVNNEVG